MLGIKATWKGLEINPCLSEQLLPAKVTRIFRGVKYNITINKNEKVFIPYDADKKEVNIEI